MTEMPKYEPLTEAGKELNQDQDNLSIDEVITKAQEDGKINNKELMDIHERYQKEKAEKLLSIEDQEKLSNFMNEVSKDILEKGIKIGPDLAMNRERMHKFISQLIKSLSESGVTIKGFDNVDEYIELIKIYESVTDSNKAYNFVLTLNKMGEIDIKADLKDGEDGTLNGTGLDSEYLNSSSDIKFNVDELTGIKVEGSEDKPADKPADKGDGKGDDRLTDKPADKPADKGDGKGDDIETEEAKAAAEAKAAEEAAKLRQAERLQSQNDYRRAMRFYENLGVKSAPGEKSVVNPDVKALQEALADKYNLPEGFSDGKMGPGTYKIIKKFQAESELADDGMAGTDTLKALGLIKDKETSKDFYKKDKAERAENEETTVSEDISEKFTQFKEWLKEIFSSDEDLITFVGANGETITVEFNDTTNTFSIDTPMFGDAINDYELSLDKHKDLEGVDDLEDAKKVVEKITKSLEAEYNAKIMESAIRTSNNVEREEDPKSTTIGGFEIDGVEDRLDIRLVTEIKSFGSEKTVKVKVDTPMGDGIDDKDVTIDLEDLNDKAALYKAIGDVEAKYRELYKAEQDKKKKEEQEK